MKPRRFEVGYLTRVEGEGALSVTIEGERVTEINLKIHEAPRFFESIVRGRMYNEVPDIVARICGLCPVSYQLVSIKAMEQILGIRVSDEVMELRRLFSLSQWISSHVLHVVFLALPDYLGFPDALSMAGRFKSLMETGLRLKQLGNDATSALGGRETHPVSAVVGGFTKIPSPHVLSLLRKHFESRREDVFRLLEFVGKLELPDFETGDGSFFASLVHPLQYPVNDGVLATSDGMHVTPQEFGTFLSETQPRESNALHALFRGKPLMVGPLARVNLNYERLRPRIRETLNKMGIRFPSRNPYLSIVARVAEVAQAVEDSIEALDEIQRLRTAPPPSAAGNAPPIHSIHEGAGCAMVEAPRGTLYHSYSLDSDGKVTGARIVAPTTQNLPFIERTLRRLVERMVHSPDDQIAQSCSVMVRNFDPCISCATHLIKILRS